MKDDLSSLKSFDDEGTEAEVILSKTIVTPESCYVM